MHANAIQVHKVRSWVNYLKYEQVKDLTLHDTTLHDQTLFHAIPHVLSPNAMEYSLYTVTASFVYTIHP